MPSVFLKIDYSFIIAIFNIISINPYYDKFLINLSEILHDEPNLSYLVSNFSFVYEVKLGFSIIESIKIVKFSFI